MAPTRAGESTAAAVRAELLGDAVRIGPPAAPDGAWAATLRVPGTVDVSLAPAAGGVVGTFVAADPAASGASGILSLDLALRTDLALRLSPDGRSIALLAEDEQVVLRVAPLGATTAAGKVLPAHLVVERDEAGAVRRWRVEVESAFPELFPLTVELLVAGPEAVDVESLPLANDATAAAVPPSNDLCDAAFPVFLDIPVTGSNAGAINDYQLADGGASCLSGLGTIAASASGRDTVWSFIAPAAGAYSFRAQNTVTGADPVIYVSSSCPLAPPVQTLAGCLAGANRSTHIAAWVATEEAFCVPLGEGEQSFLYVDEAFGTGSATPGEYRLEALRCSVEAEPNGEPALAGGATCGVAGAIVPVGDVDFFALGAFPAGSRVFALVDGAAAASTDFDLRVTGAADTLEYDDDNNDGRFGGLSPNVAGTPLGAAPAYLRVSHFSASGTAEPYRLWAVVQPPLADAAAESEPNDLPEQASRATSDYFFGQLSSGDVDHFAVTAEAGDLLFVGLDLDPFRNKTPFRGTLTLLGPSGETLVETADSSGTSSLASGAGTLDAVVPYSPGRAFAVRAAVAGTYTVRVAPSGPGADYLLSISTDCAGGERARADLALSKLASADPVVAGSGLSYALGLINRGPDGAPFVHVTDPLPAGTTFEALAAPPTWACTTPAAGGTGAITCVVPTLASGATETATLDVRLAYCLGDGAPLANTATLAAGVTETAPGDEIATATVTVQDPGTCDDADPCTAGDVCNGGDCAGTPIGGPAVENLRFGPDKVTLEWDAPGEPNVVYDVARGSLAELPVGAGGSDECLAERLADPTTTDGFMPGVPGQAVWYLVRSHGACGVGSYGFATAGTERTTTACP